jgi:L-threonylcarbamoyladenylate synthase
MPTRHPRIPNVNLALFSQSPLQARSLVHAASEPRHIPATALNLPTNLSTPKFTTPAITKSYACPRTAANMKTDILAVDPEKLGKTTFQASASDLIDEWDIEYAEGHDYQSLQRAAHELLHTDTPVAFPTETVYGLGADATRSSAVKAIFAAKGRPADNPLIVHIHSLPQLRALLAGQKDGEHQHTQETTPDPIPAIYKPLIERFWPGPLTIILPTPPNSLLAPEVTAGLSTFGARMPRSLLALSLLRLCGRPLAAPSANASTRPSPTAAEHVHDDLQGRITTIIDGGPCEVGVESTVVDGLCSPPSILRPGGITVEQLRACPGWEDVAVAYKDKQEAGSKPRAPGMKYRHYSPKAEVVLFEVGAGQPGADEVAASSTVGVIRTTTWPPALGLAHVEAMNGHATPSTSTPAPATTTTTTTTTTSTSTSTSNLLRSVTQHQVPHAHAYTARSGAQTIWDISLGGATDGVARGLFSALRELDKKGVQVIYVEGIDDASGDDIAAAVMNRLRKAAEVRPGA